jgi:hypothetical protein
MRKAKNWLVISVAMAAGASGLCAGGAENVATVTIQVAGKPAFVLTPESLEKMTRHTVTVKEHGVEASYAGVVSHDVLERAGAPSGSQLRGKALSSYVLATARDGYAVIYTLTETDPDFTDSPDIIITDQQNGKPLPDKQGPFELSFHTIKTSPLHSHAGPYRSGAVKKLNHFVVCP